VRTSLLREPLLSSRAATTRTDGLLARFHLDTPLLLALLATASLGLVVLYSAGQADEAIVTRQAIRLGVGICLMALLAQVPPVKLRLWAPWLYLIAVVLLIAVPLVGDVGKGARRWLDLGFMRFQPSEFMKLALPMMVAWHLSGQRFPPSLATTGVNVAIIAVPVLLILKQPDLGTALLVASAGFFVLFLGGLNWRVVLAVLAALGAAAPAFWRWGMHDYQRQRVLTLLDPQSDPLGSGYHIIQSKIAIGSGGVYGKGWLNGSQAHLEFLPESSTDFIFAVFAEEFGLYGSAVLLLLFCFIIGRGLYIASHAQDSYSRLITGSLSLTFFVYVGVNVGMVIGVLPVVGVPLPLISYGGTSVVTLLAGFGVMMSVNTHRKFLS
jgi:rod shape determining protein RodA